jgi:hypothetical protein
VGKGRSVIALVVIVAGLLTYGILTYGAGAVFFPVLVVVILAAGAVAFTLNTGGYERAIEGMARFIDPVIRAFRRKA